MATSFPTGLDVLTNPTSADTLASPDHAAQHANVNDAVEAIEAQIGTTASPVLARLESPIFTGVPAADTAAVATNTTQIATTAFVIANAGSTPSFGFTAGLYYRTLGGVGNNITTVVNDTVYAPFIINETKTFDRIAIRSGASHSGTGSVRLGIYNNDGATGQPSTVLLDAGTVATTAPNTIFEITISQSLPPGAYWIAFNMQTSPATPRYDGIFVNVASSFGYLVSTTGSLVANAGFWIESGITGAFTTAGSLTSANFGATCTLRSS